MPVMVLGFGVEAVGYLGKTGPIAAFGDQHDGDLGAQKSTLAGPGQIPKIEIIEAG